MRFDDVLVWVAVVMNCVCADCDDLCYDLWCVVMGAV